jgi:hypothetical protein
MDFIHKIADMWDRWGTEGMLWPFVHDPVKDKPSVTLLFFYISFFLAAFVVGISSFMLILTGKYLVATFMPILMLFASFVFYRLRRLDGVKIDLDDKLIHFDGGSEDL